VGVHVVVTRHQVLPSPVDDLRARWHAGAGAGRLYADDLVTGDADVRTGPEGAVAGINDRGPADHQLYVGCHSSPPVLKHEYM
jgi:hypothetical protein